MRIFIKFSVISIFLGLFAMATPSQSQMGDQKESPTNRCAIIYDLARVIMMARQEGNSMPEMIDEARGDQVIEAIVSNAFTVPRLDTYQDQQEVIEEFSNKTYNTCIRTILLK